METLLGDLNNFYSKLSNLLQHSVKDCGICGKCCKVVSALQVFPVELENIKRQVKNEKKLNYFVEFINGAAIRIWGNIDGGCPFQENSLCEIYPIRPYYCRIYGLYDFRGTTLLYGCVYRDHTVIYSHREDLPLIDELDSLSNAYKTLLKKPEPVGVRP